MRPVLTVYLILHTHIDTKNKRVKQKEDEEEGSYFSLSFSNKNKHFSLSYIPIDRYTTATTNATLVPHNTSEYLYYSFFSSHSLFLAHFSFFSSPWIIVIILKTFIYRALSAGRSPAKEYLHTVKNHHKWCIPCGVSIKPEKLFEIELRLEHFNKIWSQI